MEQYLDYGILGLTVFALIAYGAFVTAKWNEAVNERVRATEARLQDSKERIADAKEYVRGTEEMKATVAANTSAVQANTQTLQHLVSIWGK